MTWQDNSDERRFRVQFATGRRFLDAGVVGANTTEFVVGGLASGSTVRFRVARRAARRVERLLRGGDGRRLP